MHQPTLFDNMTHEAAARLTETLIDPDRRLTAAEKRLAECVAADVLNFPI
jgi:hypothetical protein